mgnify:CR=1 FL=1
MSKTAKTLLTVLALAAVLAPSFALAQLTGPTNPVSGGAGVNLANLRDIITNIARFLIAISLVIAVIFIIWGGIKYMTAGSDATKAGDAKSTIFNGIIGALIVLAVGVILQTLSGFVTNIPGFFSTQ